MFVIKAYIPVKDVCWFLNKNGPSRQCTLFENKTCQLEGGESNVTQLWYLIKANVETCVSGKGVLVSCTRICSCMRSRKLVNELNIYSPSCKGLAVGSEVSPFQRGLANVT